MLVAYKIEQLSANINCILIIFKFQIFSGFSPMLATSVRSANFCYSRINIKHNLIIDYAHLKNKFIYSKLIYTLSRLV